MGQVGSYDACIGNPPQVLVLTGLVGLFPPTSGKTNGDKNGEFHN